MDEANDLTEKIRELTDRLTRNPERADLYFERGKLYWKIGEKGSAMSDFNAAMNIDPNSPAKGYLDMANDIMDFYNTDLYNP